MKQSLPKWTGLCLVLLQLFAFTSLFGQQHAKSTAIGAVSTTIALGNTAGLHTQLVYDNADFGIRPGSGNITRLWFRRNGTDQVTLSNLVIRLGQTSSTSDYVSGGAFFTGLSQVYAATGWTVPAGVASAWFAIDLTTPFSYDPSQRLIVDITFSASSNTGFAVVSSSTSTFKKLFSASATATTGSTSSVWPDFGLSFAAPSNDLCSGATPLIPSRNCSYTLSGNTMGATGGFSTTPCSGFFSTNPDDEVWYSFVAHGQGDTISVSGIGAFDPVIEAFASCGSIAAPTRIACADASTTGGTETLILPSLTAGATYRIRVFSYDAFRGNFTICLRNANAISNDECVNAIPLSASTFCNSTSASNLGATQSLSPSSCNNFISSKANDVWFSFVAFNESDSIIVDGLGSLDAVVEIRDGCSGASVACTDVGGTGFEYLQPGNLVPGRTYKVRVYGWNGAQGNFSICQVYHGIPSNDDCSNPVQLEVGTSCNYLYRNTFSASGESNFGNCAGLNPDDAVWFSFVAPSPAVQVNVTQTFFSGTAFFNFNPAVEAYSNCSAGSLIQCVNTSNLGNNPEILNLTNLTPGQTYLIRVYHAGAGSGNVGFGICVIDAFCEPKVGKASISPSNRDIVSNGSVQVSVPFHQGNLMWEFSTDGINFTGDQSKTSDTVVFVPKTATGAIYYFRARVTDGICDPVYSDTVSIPVRCHSAFAFTSLGDLSYITSINVEAFTKASSFDPKGGAYQDFRNDTIRICLSNTRSKSALMKMDMNQANTSVRRMVWVDFNQNGVFGDVANEYVHVGNAIQAQTVSMPLSLAGAVQDGNYTMRVAALANIDGNVVFPCVSQTYIGFGEIEEYTLSIQFEPVANAGSDQVTCSSQALLVGNGIPVGYAGQWSVLTGQGLSGEGIFQTPNDSSSFVSNLKPGINGFVWTLSGPCGTFSDTVLVQYIPVVPNAGTDQQVCTTTVVMAANPVPAQTLGQWSVIEGAGFFTDLSSPTSLVFNAATGINRYVWTFNPGFCDPVSDTVTVIVREEPTPAFAGNDTTICLGSGLQMRANSPLAGSGTWTRISGTASVVNPSNPTSLLSNLSAGTHRFRWTISNPPCADSFDEVVIQVNPAPVANAGADQVVCQDTIQLTGNNPTGAAPNWSRISGSGFIFNDESATTEVAGIGLGINAFEYSLQRSGCPISRDTVLVTRKITPVPANAGNYQLVCENQVSLAATAPQEGSGRWSVVSGTGTIQNPNQANSLVTSLSAGINEFQWKVSNSPCPSDSATVVIEYKAPIQAQAGFDQNICQFSTQLSGNAIDPDFGTGTWTLIQGSGIIADTTSAETAVSSLGAGINRFVYHVRRYNCPGESTDTVTVRVRIPQIAQAGTDQFVFQSTASLSASPSGGSWSRISGSGSVQNPNQANTTVSGLGLGENTFVYTFAQLPCPVSVDTVIITRNPIPNVCQGILFQVNPEGGASASVQLDVLGNFSFQSHKILLGDGSQLRGSGDSFTGSHSYPAPGLYNACARLFYTNVLNQPDSCEVCDTVRIPEPVSPCGTASIATTYMGSGFDVQSNFSGSSQFQSWKVSMGDGTQFSGSGNTGSISHSYSNPGTFNTCVRYFFANVFQQPDSCEVCDTVLIPEPFNPCPGFGMVRLLSDTIQVSEPDSVMGRYYSLSDSVFFSPGSFTEVTVKVSRSATDAPEITGSLVPASTASSLSFNLTLKPGQNYVCYTGRFVNSFQELDSCVVCTTQVLAYPPACDLFSLEKKPICRNSYQAKAHFSTQSVFDSVWVRLDEENDQAFYLAKSGDSVVFEGLSPGKHRICALAIRKQDPNQDKLDLPGFTCAVCDSITIAPGPDAGSDLTVCADSIGRMSSAIPSGYVARWERVSGNSVLDVSNPAELRVGQLSIGENRFALVFFKNDQTCPEEADTFTVTRVAPVLADAGPDQTTTLNFVNLAAGNPSGTWTKISGTGLISDPSSPTSLVTGLTPGSHRFVWTVESLPCPSSSDTVTILVNDACQGIAINARHTTGYFGEVVVKGPDLVTPVSVELDFGDGTVTSLPNDTLTHLYPGDGDYNVCVKFRYLHPNQSLDSCVVCDTIRIPEFVSPCGTFGFTATVLSSDIPFDAPNQPDSLVGRYYDYVVDLSHLGTSISGTQFSFDGGNWLNVINYGPHDSAFAYVLAPKNGDRQLCVRGFYLGPDGKQDTCVVCQTFQNPFPEACTQLKLESRVECRNQVVVKARFSDQGRFDSVFVAIDSVLYPISRSGDSVQISPSPGKHSICAVSRLDPDQLRPIGLDLPGFDCSQCDTLEIEVGPDAGTDLTVCADSIGRMSSAIPSGYVARWERVSGNSVLDVSNSAELRAGQLSVGENRFALVFFKNDQTCPEEADTFSVFREAPPIADAGNDRFICSDTLTLLGFGGNGTWLLVSGSAQLEATGPQTALVSGLGIGQNVFHWIVAGGICPSDTDEVLVVREAPVVANAGSDRTLCADSARLQATGAGIWEVISGAGQLADSNDPETWIRQLGPGSTLLRWIATSQVCPADSDEVQLTLAVPADAFAGQDDTVYVPSANLNGSDPGSGTGTWNQIVGTSAIQNPTQASTLAEGLSQGLNRFVWTIENVACETDTKSNGPGPISKDTVDIYYFQPVVAVAGKDTSICEGGIFQLQASSAGQGIGTWMVLNGTGIISDPSNPNATVSGLSLGDNLLTWSVQIPGLEASVDSIVLSVQAQPIANAGQDQTICSSSTNLAANGAGFWTLLAGDGQIANPNQASSLLSSISIGENLFTWTVIGGACANAVDTIRILRQEPISQAQAGQDQQVCSNETTLNALLPAIGIGSWSMVEGSGQIADPANAQSAVTNLNPGITRLVWTVSGNGCPVSTDTVSIRVDERPIANAGIDQQVCGDSTRLGAITASAGIGFWESVFSGPTVQSPATELTDVLNLQPGANTFRWIVTNGVCPSDTDLVVVTSFGAPTQANAGLDQNICGNSAFMEGNVPQVGTGLWSVVSGAGTFLNPDSPTSIVTNLGAGPNTFRWTISNTSCPSTSDDVVLNATPAPIADAGPDLVACGGSTTLNANLAPGANGLWILESGTGLIVNPGNPGSSLQQMTSPTARLVWVVQSGICTSTDTLVIVNQANPLNYWPSDSIICSDSLISLNAPFGMTSYLWNDGSTGGNLLVDTLGLYWVEIITPQACVFRDSIQVSEIDCQTSVSSPSGQVFKMWVHPNPGKGKFVIRLEEEDRITSGELLITNQLGQVVEPIRNWNPLSGQDPELNLEHLPNGVYYLEIRTKQRRYREKLILVK